jgi:hypothetical protein
MLCDSVPIRCSGVGKMCGAHAIIWGSTYIFTGGPRLRAPGLNFHWVQGPRCMGAAIAVALQCSLPRRWDSASAYPTTAQPLQDDDGSDPRSHLSRRSFTTAQPLQDDDESDPRSHLSRRSSSTAYSLQDDDESDPRSHLSRRSPSTPRPLQD